MRNGFRRFPTSSFHGPRVEPHFSLPPREAGERKIVQPGEVSCAGYAKTTSIIGSKCLTALPFGAGDRGIVRWPGRSSLYLHLGRVFGPPSGFLVLALRTSQRRLRSPRDIAPRFFAPKGP
jgi:hypothetical protein